MASTLKSALLITDSHLWGLWCYHALKKAKIAFEPILAKEITKDFPQRYKALFVPGGWSKNKLQALTEAQRDIIRDFVAKGGLYFGICGGASLAGEEGLDISKVYRKKERVPSYSGPCVVSIQEGSSLWKGIRRPIFYLWFPPELEVRDASAKVIASFAEPDIRAYVSDLCLADHQGRLSFYEKRYGIPLNPEKMKNKPLMTEATYGKGKVLLSLIHYDTPHCKNSQKFLKNLKEYYELPTDEASSAQVPRKLKKETSLTLNLKKILASMKRDIDQLLKVGMRNFLFHRRYPYFYQWQRGIRGLEFLNLYFMVHEIDSILDQAYSKEILEKIEATLTERQGLYYTILSSFQKEFSLFRENFSKMEDSDKDKEIFGENKKSYGGKYRELINLLEELLVYLWREKGLD